jgi:hypothetical protein
MRKVLQRPYRSPHTDAGGVVMALVFGAFVFLFLFLFRPFSLSMAPRGLFLLSLGYGAVCTATMVLLNVLVPLLLPAFFRQERWTVGREVLWVMVNLAIIGLANLFFSRALGFIGLTLPGLLRFEAYTFLIGLFPVTLVVLINEARLTRRYSQYSDRMNHVREAQVKLAPDPWPASQNVLIPSENGKEDITLPLTDLLFIRSSGNYMEVYHGSSGVKKQLLRGSLKRVEEALADRNGVLRCHKSHIVNLGQVERVSGNAQGFRLHFAATEETVPVSRSLNARLGELLAARP